LRPKIIKKRHQTRFFLTPHAATPPHRHAATQIELMWNSSLVSHESIKHCIWSVFYEICHNFDSNQFELVVGLIEKVKKEVREQASYNKAEHKKNKQN